MATEFSLSRFHEVTNDVAKLDSLKLSTVLSMFNEITFLFHCLGTALSFATSDVVTKLKHVQSRTHEMIKAGLITVPYEEVTVNMIMETEKQQNWHISGSDGIDKKGKEYQNASRSMVRLVWFLDFVYEMVWYMRQKPDESLTTVVKYAYNKILSPRHSTLIRGAFKVAVVIIPSKASFIEKISNGHTPEQVDQLWIYCENDMKIVSDKFWNYFKKEGMDDLPYSVCLNKQRTIHLQEVVPFHSPFAP